MTRRLRFFGGALVAAALVFATGPLALAQYPTDAGTDAECAQIFDSGGEPTVALTVGETGTVAGQAGSGRQCVEEGSFFEVFFIQSETRVASGTANADGSYFAQFQVPLGADPNRAASIEVRGTAPGGGPVTYSRTVDIVAAGAAAPGTARPGLPITGRNVVLLALWGVGLIVLGGALIAGTWRVWRRSKHEAAHEAGLDFGPASLDVSDDDFFDLRPAPPERVVPATEEIESVEEERVLVGASASAAPSLEAARPAPAQPVRPQPRPVRPASERRDLNTIAQRATERTSQIVARLEEEISAWSEPR